MTFDLKHLAALVAGALLSIGITILGAKTGVDVKPVVCQAPAPAVIAPAAAQAIK